MKQPLSATEQALFDAALDYHRLPTPGKITVAPTKPLSNQRDLSLAYSPRRGLPLPGNRSRPEDGGAVHLAQQPGRGHHQWHGGAGTGVILAHSPPSPLWRARGCLFRKFAGIDVFDIELAERDTHKLVDIIAAMEPTLGWHQPRGHQGTGML